MAKATKVKRTGRGGKLARSEVVTVRLDPRLRYLAELAARRERRTLSSFVEAAVEQALSTTKLNGSSTVAQMAHILWDVVEADRLAKLAFYAPDLLTFEEQIAWKLICENGAVWAGEWVGPDREWSWTIDENDLMLDRLRLHWPTFLGVARGHVSPSELPDWKRHDDTPEHVLKRLEEDDIPF